LDRAAYIYVLYIRQSTLHQVLCAMEAFAADTISKAALSNWATGLYTDHHCG
jgi:hypothetical protein